MEYFSTQIFSDILTTDVFEISVDSYQELSSVKTKAPIEWQFSVGIEKFFKPVPTWQHVFAIWLLLVTGWVTNSVIIKIYWRLKSSNRVYVLAMAFMDLTALTFVLLPRFVLLFVGESVVGEVIEIIRYTLSIFIFTLYMFLPLFLALDRFVAVSYPHKMIHYLQRLRPFKVGCIVHCCLQVTAAMAIEVLLGTDSVWFNISSFYGLLAVTIEVVSALTLYVIVAVKVTMSRKKMKKHRTLNSQRTYFFC